jgi:hypothetical protein
MASKGGTKYRVTRMANPQLVPGHSHRIWHAGDEVEVDATNDVVKAFVEGGILATPRSDAGKAAAEAVVTPSAPSKESSPGQPDSEDPNALPTPLVPPTF